MYHRAIFRTGIIAVATGLLLGLTGCTGSSDDPASPGTTRTASKPDWQSTASVNPRPTQSDTPGAWVPTDTPTPTADPDAWPTDKPDPKPMTLAQYDTFIEKTWPAAMGLPVVGGNDGMDGSSCDAEYQAMKWAWVNTSLGAADMKAAPWRVHYLGMLYPDADYAKQWTSAVAQCLTKSGDTVTKGPTTSTNAIGATTSFALMDDEGEPWVSLTVQYLNATLTVSFWCPDGKTCSVSQAPTLESQAGVINAFTSAVDTAMK